MHLSFAVFRFVLILQYFQYLCSFILNVYWLVFKTKVKFCKIFTFANII